MVLAFEVLVFDFLKFFIFQIFNTFLDIPHWQLRWTVGKKTKTKLSSEKYSGVLVFEVLAFEVLVFEILVFEVLDLRS